MDYVRSLRPTTKATIAQKLSAFTKIDKYITKQGEIGVIGEAMQSHCLRHQKMCPVYPVREEMYMPPLRIHWAGATCVPWSRLGSRSGDAHAASEAFSIYITEQTTCKADFSFLEEADTFPIEKHFTQKMEKAGFVVVSLKLAPYHTGWPVGGTRTFACAINKERERESDIWIIT